jgi:hypothetical protein
VKRIQRAIIGELMVPPRPKSSWKRGRSKPREESSFDVSIVGVVCSAGSGV